MVPHSSNNNTPRLLPLLLSLTLLAATAAAHPICVDSTFPSASLHLLSPHCPNATYAATSPPSSCCSAAAADAVGAALAAAAGSSTPACQELRRRVLCAECSPYAGHLLGTEGGGAARAAPFMNASFCASYTEECGLAPSLCAEAVPADPFYAVPMAAAESPPPSELEVAFENLPPLPFLVGLEEHPATPRLYVVQKSGEVWTMANPPAAAEAPALFLNLSSAVRNSGEMGLLGLAFDPRAPASGSFSFYVNYVTEAGAAGRRTVVSRFAAPSPAGPADEGSEEVLLELPQPYSNHNGGWMGFDPADTEGRELVVAVGDGGSGNDPLNSGQDNSTLLGALVALDTSTGAASLYATGLRNPWRCSFDTRAAPGGRGHPLWCADVGQARREEVNVVARGQNLGWKPFEGTCELLSGTSRDCGRAAAAAAAPYTAPLFDYPRTADDEFGDAPGVHGRSVTGGHVYRGADRRLFGSYFFADYASRRLFRLTPGDVLAHPDDTEWRAELVTAEAPAVSSFGRDRFHNLYVVGFTTSEAGERVYRLGERSDVEPPAGNTDGGGGGGRDYTAHQWAAVAFCSASVLAAAVYWRRRRPRQPREPGVKF